MIAALFNHCPAGPFADRQFYGDTPHRVDVVDETASVDWPGGWAWFYAYCENMYDPRRYLVRGEGSGPDEQMQDAYDRLLLLPGIVADCGIRDEDRGDYSLEDGEDDRVTYNDEGVALDTESVKLVGPVRVRLIFGDAIPPGF